MKWWTKFLRILCQIQGNLCSVGCSTSEMLVLSCDRLGCFICHVRSALFINREMIQLVIAVECLFGVYLLPHAPVVALFA